MVEKVNKTEDMSLHINPEKIVTVAIVEPYENGGESWEIYPSHDWQLKITVGYLEDGSPITEVIERPDKEEILNIFRKIATEARLINLNQP